MRKRVSRPPRFAAVDNNAIDGLPSILSVGLLTTLIRAKDGEDVTVESLTQKYDEGEKALTKAMRALVDRANVVKFKIQRAISETVVEDGKKVVKRGGSWYTTFTVDSIPFTREDIADMLEGILDAGNVKAVRVEPTHLDPRKQFPTPTAPKSARPTPPKGGVGPTCGNTGSERESEAQDPENSGPRPTPPSAAPGRPTPGQGGALYRNKTSLSLSDSAAAPDGSSPDGEREEAPPRNDTPAAAPQQSDADDPAAPVIDAYVTACLAATKLPPRPATLQQLHTDATALLAAGRTAAHLTQLVTQMPDKGWTSLWRHAEKNPEPKRPGAVKRPWCGECNDGREPDSAAQRMRQNAEGRWAKCSCHPGYVPTPVNA